MSQSVLDDILASTRADVRSRQADTPLDALRERIASAPAVRSLATALRPGAYQSARLIAEIKRASPSRGVLAPRLDAAEQAKAYVRGGASAISVLTEGPHFHGSLADLEAVRAISPVPVLRKDFILTPYQVFEARAHGADALLLICAALDDSTLRELLALTRTLGMEALVEAHTDTEVRRALAADASIIGINARNLGNFAMDHNLPHQLAALVPRHDILVSESGLHTPADVARARAWGADAVLVGEALMRAESPATAAHALATAGGGATGTLLARRVRTFVKICGLAQEEHVQLAKRLGADAFGLVFAPMAPPHRRVDVAKAQALVATRGEAGPLAVGIFVNEDVATITSIAKAVPLDAIQLSGDEPPRLCEAVASATCLPVIKAVRLIAAEDVAHVDEYAAAGTIPLLDASRPGSFGGTGQRADWALAAAAARRTPLILAGGLTPGNVGEALAATSAQGVDVSSGVERGGRKDEGLITQFIAAAQGHERDEKHLERVAQP